MGSRGFRITTPWCVQDGENPWLLSAYDEYTEDAHNGTPEFFSTEVDNERKAGSEVRIVELLVDYDRIESTFAAIELPAEVSR